MTDKLYVFLVSADESFIASHKERLARKVDLNVHRSAAPGEVHKKLQTVIAALETLAGEVEQQGDRP